MIQPGFKVCPRCGQRLALSMPACGRCGRPLGASLFRRVAIGGLCVAGLLWISLAFLRAPARTLERVPVDSPRATAVFRMPDESGKAYEYGEADPSVAAPGPITLAAFRALRLNMDRGTVSALLGSPPERYVGPETYSLPDGTVVVGYYEGRVSGISAYGLRKD